MGTTTCRLIQIQGQIHDIKLQVLINSGTNLNFIHGRWARQLELRIDSSSKMNVLVGNGNIMTCQGVCRRMRLTMGLLMFCIDLHELPIHGADVILGVTWLETLGQVTFNYAQRSISFADCNLLQTLMGSSPLV